MTASITNIICLIYIYAALIHTATSATSVSLKFIDSAGRQITTKSAEEGSRVTVRCEYRSDPPDNDQTRVVKFYTYASESAPLTSSIRQYSCVLPPNAQTAVVTSPEGVTLTDYVTNKVCSSDSLSFEMTMAEEIPYVFECSYDNFQNEVLSGNQTLRSHVTPSAPEVTVPQDATREGDELTFTCKSEARPPPKLRFRLDNTAVDDTDTSRNITQTPASSTISLDSNFGQSVLTWVTTANKDMNGQTLVCDVYGHPSTEPKTGEKDVAVIFGPESQPTRAVSWNLKDQPEQTFTCSLPSNPEPSYVWYNGSVTTGTVLPGSAKLLVLRGEDYSYVTVDSGSVRQSYSCQGTNNKNNGKTGEMTFTIEIMTTAKPPDNGGKPGGSSTGGTEEWTWQWALIAIAAVAVIVVLVVGVIFIKRRNSSSPAKIKKAAAKNLTPASDHSPTYPYSSTGQPDIIRNNPVSQYNSSPAHQPNNRYSQPNVEDYASAIDHAPRSRKPVVLDEMELDPYNAPPASEAGPPAYHDSYTDMENGGYGGMRSPHDSYNLSYGAAC